MRIDEHGAIVMERDGSPGDLGDSCAETGRFVILSGSAELVQLRCFITKIGFVRHPYAPTDWREADFTSDQGNYLLMAAWLTDKHLFRTICEKVRSQSRFPRKWFRTGHILSLDSLCIMNEWFHLLGVLQVGQILLNFLPVRWSDDQSRSGFWKYWRLASSKNSTVSFMTTFVTTFFLRRAGVIWPQLFFNRKKYLQKSLAFYACQPNAKWFTDRFHEEAT